ncbi:MAG TPA: insulinase family protein, partial [Candidatus Nanoarchaeia archaeon]|nr:insulinase family protein [Candidatus Nanoarchaeia archaeon]
MKGTWGLVFFFFLLGCSQSYKLCEAPSCETHVLSNGLTVVLKEDHKAPVATAELWVRTGTINEDNATNGLSHYLEHVLFKPWKDGRRFDDVVESSGGRLNGGT